MSPRKTGMVHSNSCVDEYWERLLLKLMCCKTLVEALYMLSLFQIQVSEAKYTGVTQTLVKIGKDEGLYGYFKV